MARPRSITDERLLDAAAAVLSSTGPGFRLAQVAERAGVAVGTVEKRFGSRHGLLCAMSRAAIAAAKTSPGQFDGGDPVQDVAQTLVGRYAALDDAAAAANNLAALAADLADVELRGLLAQLHTAIEDSVHRALAKASLPGAPPNAARILAALADGTALRWSTAPSEPLSERMLADLMAVLDGWR